MTKTKWKRESELRYALRDAHRITIIACSVCANLSNTGGRRGLKYLRGILKTWGKDVVAVKSINACCAEEVMRQALRINRKHLDRSDALIILSCASGVKSAFLCGPDLPVIAALDTIGGVPVSRSEDPVATSICSSCDSCVISFTGGICPISRCPAGALYEPCSRYPENGTRCAVDPGRSCVWKDIEERGDLEALLELKRVHQAEEDKRLSLPERRQSPLSLRRISGWVVARSRGFGRLVHFVD